MKSLLELVYTPRGEWDNKARSAFSESLRERYPRIPDLTDRRNDERRFQLRVNSDSKEGAVPYAALIPPDQEMSGGYGGMSFVMFPADEPGNPALISMVVGTNGLAPDEMVLGRPGHRRKCAAVASWINRRNPGSAWAKQDPVRIDLDLPRSVASNLTMWSNACRKYGSVLYMTFASPGERAEDGDRLVEETITALIDLFFEERRIDTKKAFEEDSRRIRRAWMAEILPSTTRSYVNGLLQDRRFVILEGPPGTGKTELARELLDNDFAGFGEVIQFHPGTTYESFVGGLAPREGGALGFTFTPTRGHLMEAVLQAQQNPNKPYLLVIDEINRADLSKVLGEAIYLLEPDRPDRQVTLPHDFDGLGRSLALPPNLHILGTMNSADRSIAILDIAIRRRFAFVPMWPQSSVVEEHSGDTLQSAFHSLLTIFVEHATDDAFVLMPGHAYFLGGNDEAPTRLATSVRPLLEEYMRQGYVAGFSDEISAFLATVAGEVEA